MKTEQQLEQQLQQALNQLPREIQPSRDLWPELSARLDATPQLSAAPKRRYWPAIAAAVMLSLMWPLWQGVQSNNAGLITKSKPSAEAKLRLTSTAEKGLNPVASSLISDFEREKSRQLAQVTFVPSEFADFQRQLDIWQQATSQVALALEFRPDDPKLIKQLTRLQQQQIQYISRLVRVGQMS